ncbi:hypothetical protein TSUD_334560 [Trifolium subterraneum]|uniref:RNase H type-1 domain-containing protein n=1 Tax=Trifolium subterraneum TaxID=3900 RepID=A0A2Z6LJT0_TRISU|nr:hypothetical protein TSUD_334560 [Trifolium subterraneum]
MQYAKLPKSLCNEMEKIQRSFLWGDTNQSRRPHLVGWDVCCLPMNEGGLGIKKLHHMNDAFLMKMMWNLITKPNDLWCKVLYSKYGRNNDLRVTINSQSYDSPLWKALSGIWDQFQQNIVWQVLAIPAPKDIDGQDSIGWGGTNNRGFTVKSAYDSHNNISHPIEGDWKTLWSWKGPHRIQTFMWMAPHEREWIFKNINNQLLDTHNKKWSTIFMVACWHMWMWRNKTIFEDQFQHPNDSIFKILKMVEDINKYTQHPLNIHQCNTVFIGWNKPREGWIKLNCDGAYKDSLGLAGCGGLFRNSDGRWIKGYARKIGTCDALCLNVGNILGNVACLETRFPPTSSGK